MKKNNRLLSLFKTGLIGAVHNETKKDRTINQHKNEIKSEDKTILSTTHVDYPEEVFQIIDKYSEYDMSMFNKNSDIYNYRKMRTSNLRNEILIESTGDRDYTIKVVNTLLSLAKEKIAEYDLNVILSDEVKFKNENETGRTLLRFTPFTKTGKVKKFPYELSFQTKEIVVKKCDDFEYMTFDGAPFGRVSLDCNFRIGKAEIHIWGNDTRNSYSFKLIDDKLVINNIVKCSLQDTNDGKPETVIFKM